MPDERLRFGFGANWERYLRDLDDERVAIAKDALAALIGRDLTGARFLDVGSGSGIHSLAAWSLGADVHSFDFDPDSVACTEALRDRAGATNWVVEEGSALDREYLESLGTFDVVYSWGVLHHTGAMWEAIANTTSLVAPGGVLALAIYNYQPGATERWTWVKRRYNASGRVGRAVLLGLSFLRLWLRPMARDLFRRGDPRGSWKEYSARGMDPKVDLVDWVGGYPYEAATPEDVIRFVSERGYAGEVVSREYGHGCNQFRFVRN